MNTLCHKRDNETTKLSITNLISNLKMFLFLSGGFMNLTYFGKVTLICLKAQYGGPYTVKTLLKVLIRGDKYLPSVCVFICEWVTGC